MSKMKADLDALVVLRLFGDDDNTRVVTLNIGCTFKARIVIKGLSTADHQPLS